MTSTWLSRSNAIWPLAPENAAWALGANASRKASVRRHWTRQRMTRNGPGVGAHAPEEGAQFRCAFVQSAPAQAPRRGPHAQHLRGHAGHDRVGRHVLGDDRARADDRVVADAHAAQHAGAVAHPDVVADAHVALVDALLADGALDLDDAVVEVDEHHAVGDDALAPDRHVLEGGDRALLPEHGLRADAHLALVRADLRAVADPRPAAQVEPGVLADLQRDARAHERDAVEHEPAAEAQLQPREAREEPEVLAVEHPVRAQEAHQRQRAAVQGRRLAAHDRRRALRDGLESDPGLQHAAGSLTGMMARP